MKSSKIRSAIEIWDLSENKGESLVDVATEKDFMKALKAEIARLKFENGQLIVIDIQKIGQGMPINHKIMKPLNHEICTTGFVIISTNQDTLPDFE